MYPKVAMAVRTKGGRKVTFSAVPVARPSSWMLRRTNLRLGCIGLRVQPTRRFDIVVWVEVVVAERDKAFDHFLPQFRVKELQEWKRRQQGCPASRFRHYSMSSQGDFYWENTQS